MTERKLLGFGHSHLSAIAKGWSGAHRAGYYPGIAGHFVRLNTATFQPLTENVTASPELLDDQRAMAKLTKRLRGPLEAEFASGERVRVLTDATERRLGHIFKRQEPDAVLLACMGNEYNTLGMLKHPEPYDFEMPGSDLPVVEGAQVIPYAMMRAQMQAMAEQNVLLYWRFFNDVTGDVPVYMVPPPPPIASEEHIMSYPGAFADRAKEYGISPVSLRRKMWMLYCQVLRETVAGTNTVFLELPELVFSNGCLAQQFWQEDPTHGNREYGNVILDHVLSTAFAEELEA